MPDTPIRPVPTFVCACCDQTTPTRARVYTPDESHYCRACFDRECTSCERCDNSIWRSEAFTLDDYYYCEGCYRRQRGNNIKEYGYKPDPDFLRVSTDGDRDPHYGLELEVEAKDSEQQPNDMAGKIKDDSRYFKSDGSLNNGFEIVTHPMSEGWIKTNKKVFSQMLETLRGAKYKSYQTSTCGMHIHISKDSFTTWHLYRFMKFFYENKELILLISQRKEENLNQWAKLGMYDQKAILTMAKRKLNRSDRYQAINLTNHTAEIRIFRGTLNERSFFKNIEFCASLFKFSRITNGGKVTAPNYFNWVKENKQNYPNLNGWLNDKSEQIVELSGYVYQKEVVETKTETEI